MRTFWVYMMANQAKGLYTGITSNLLRRVFQHRHRQVPGFTTRYNMIHLVYCEGTTDVRSALAREKQIKRWSRKKKVALVTQANPEWRDLAADWFET
jgi:putative endonuclease